MTRQPVTVVILAWNAWGSTRSCLNSLRPTLGPRDEVVVVDNGSSDETPQALRQYPWVRVVTNSANRGFAGGCNDGLGVASHELVVFLNNDTLLTGRWLDPLVAPFDDPAVGATGPRSNFVSGSQLVESARYQSLPEMRKFAREWGQLNRGGRSDTERLVGFCLMVRKEALQRVGGFDESFGLGGYEDDDLCRRLRAAGYRLLVCHDSFVHHEGHKTFDANGLDWYQEQESNRDLFVSRHSGGVDARRPYISACLIVKDEEDNLPDCLDSLTGLVDEVIVYDTGSVDSTVRVAEEHGATVQIGYWDDDFARARNAALEHCRGEIIVWLDADETLEISDPAEVRKQLAASDQRVDGWSIAIVNQMGSGTGSTFVHRSARIFRRSACEWVGRIHEQLAKRGSHELIVQAQLDSVRIHHKGYLDSVLVARNKRERNLQLARAEVESSQGWKRGVSLTSLARSLVINSRWDEAFEAASAAVEEDVDPATRRMALRTCVESLIGSGRLAEASDWCDRLRRHSLNPLQADVFEARIAAAQRDYQRALELLDRVDPRDVDEDGFSHPAGSLAVHKAEALVGEGLPGRAADALIEALFESEVLDTHIGTVIELLRDAGRPLDALVEAIPEVKAPMFLAQVLQLDPALADEILEVAVNVEAISTPALATAASVAKRLPLERAIIWSARIRSAGYSSSCPLVAIASSGEPAVSRARAAAVAAKAFQEPRSAELFRAALSSASDSDRQQIFAEVNQIHPDLLVELGISTTVPSARTDRALAQPAGNPRVTVVIPCFNNAEMTLACLESLQRCTEPSLYELVLVDNGSSDATADLQSAATGRFTVLRNRENTGFGPACNQGATHASGEYICFLNNDTILTPGWLDALVAALDEDPELAAVQPKLIYPDGRLNDAGGLIFEAGQPWVYGKGHPDPSAPQFSTRRAPDYASGACLLVRKAAFDQVGGFDDRYAPAYYEDTDLSFSLREHGWKVLYEPAATVVHVEGGTAGTDVTVGLKQYQSRNATRFAEKWSDELSRRDPLNPARIDDWAHRPQGGYGPGERRGGVLAPRSAAAAARAAHQVLVLDLAMPMFDRASGSLRLFNLMRCMREAGHAVTFYATTGGDRRYADAIGRFGITCYGSDRTGRRAATGSSAYAPALSDLLSTRRFDIIMVSPWSLGEQALPIVRQFAPDASVWLDTNDVHFLRLERAAALSGDPRDRLVARDTRKRELDVYRRVDRIIAVSDQDARLLQGELPGSDVRVVPNAHEIPPLGPGFDPRRGCVFVGNFNHLPNGDAVAWWRDEIAGRLDGDAALAGLTVVGNDPLGTAASMAGAGIAVTGAVPSTLPYLHRARVSVAPLRYGAGMKGKVGEALAAGVPVVATSIAAEGMSLVDGVHVLIADSPDEFAAAVRRLHDDRSLWESMREAGRAHIAENFGIDRLRTEVNALMGVPSAMIGSPA